MLSVTTRARPLGQYARPDSCPHSLLSPLRNRNAPRNDLVTPAPLARRIEGKRAAPGAFGMQRCGIRDTVPTRSGRPSLVRGTECLYTGIVSSTQSWIVATPVACGGR